MDTANVIDDTLETIIVVSFVDNLTLSRRFRMSIGKQLFLILVFFVV